MNTSGTLAAALDALGDDGTPLVVHLSQRLPADLWLVELRRPNGRATEPWFEDPPGRDAAARRRRARATWRHASSRRTRLWVATLDLPDPVLTYLAVHGRPIRYGYVTRDWPLDTYQNVYAREPGQRGDAERGPAVHTRARHPPRRPRASASRRSCCTPACRRSKRTSTRTPSGTASRRRPRRASTRPARDGGRVIAIGTTVVRALETVVDARRIVHPGEGWTDVVVTPERGAHAVDGLLTGWHEPEASHLQMLEAIAGRDRARRRVRRRLGRGLPLARVRRRQPPAPVDPLRGVGERREFRALTTHRRG